MDIQLNSATTNESFASLACSQTSSSVFFYFNYPPTGFKLIWPPCWNSSATLSVASFTGFRLVIQDFSLLPTGLTVLSGDRIVFEAENSTSLGFDSSGNLDWTAVFARLSNLEQWYITDATMSASLPSSLPASMKLFRCTYCNLEGPIPSTLFDGVSGQFYQIDVTGNLLNGSLPSALFCGLIGKPFTSSGVTIRFTSNQLSGSLPASFFTPLGSATMSSGFFTLEMQYNQLYGEVPSFPTMTSSSYSGVFFNMSSNAFTGSIPDLKPLTPRTALSIDFGDNSLSGSLPSLLVSTWAEPDSYMLALNFSYNDITGTIPGTLIAGSFTQNVSFNELRLVLDSNQLTGTIPSVFMRSNPLIGPIALYTFHLGLANNRLNGTIPSNLLPETLFDISPYYFLFSASNNSLTGTVPPSLLSGIPTNSLADATLDVSFNPLWGSPPALCWNTATLSLNMTFTALNGTFPTTWTSACKYQDIDFGNNPFLTGSIDSTFFKNTRADKMTFRASHTGLTGIMPPVSQSVPLYLDLSFTLISFCTAPQTTIDSFANHYERCILTCTEASYCSDSYVNCDSGFCQPIEPPVSTPVPTPVTTPVTAPTTSPVNIPTAVPASPIANPATPIDTPVESSPMIEPFTTPVSSSTPFGCPANTRPSLEFVCINGVWTAQSVNSTTLVIPSGAGNIIVTGNVTSTSIVINGIGTTITIDGCATNLTNIVVEIDAEEIAKLGSKLVQELLSLKNGQNCTNLANVGVSTLVKGSSCKKVKANKVFSGNTLSAAFTVDTSGCNKWWIILVSVICGVVVIGVIAAVVAIHLVNKKKEANASKFLKQSNTG